MQYCKAQAVFRQHLQAFYKLIGHNSVALRKKLLCVCVCIRMCVFLSVCKHDNSNNIEPIKLKVEHVIVDEMISHSVKMCVKNLDVYSTV